MDINDFYRKRIEELQGSEKSLKEKINFYSLLRLIIFVGGLIFTILAYVRGLPEISIILLMAFLTVFIVVAFNHSKLIEEQKKISEFIHVNEMSLKRVEEKWNEFEQKGEEFIDKDHPYSNDLDLFGNSSLYQWINSTVTYRGKQRLKNMLMGKKPISAEEVYRRQEAIKELGKEVDLRQNLMVEGRLSSHDIKDPEEIIAWGKSYNSFLTLFWPKLMFTMIPLVTMGLIIIFFTTRSIPKYVPELAVMFQIIVLQIGKKERVCELNTAYKFKKDLKAYGSMLGIIDNANFKSDYLKEIEKSLFGYNEKSSTEQIKALNNILNFIADRSSFIYIVINTLFLWDYHCIIALEKWKKNYGDNLGRWIDAIASIEELSSFSVIAQDYEDFNMPKITESQKLLVEARDISHPLIGKRAVSNDVNLGMGKEILLITGSNMSGKSTLLRTLGINLVLAYCGAPVKASYFKCSIMDIYTCMRTGDNLEENISSFYAEILRIKKLIDASEKGIPVFFLLDEIFKGTNSRDRHKGAEILIDQLSKKKAIGLVSTHDLELGDIEKTNTKVANYHFREYYEKNEIHFDYKLREGISTTQNAIYLMKMAGIKMD